ncbi:MAG: hypothetical protein FD156_1781 [Nitrospirae bacterium]|nr:MAG: hypothetical protein FD156_1781 [Nitrospirota bacterium]
MIEKKAISLRNLLVLGMPVLFLCIPLFLGYNWNIMGYGVGDHNIYNRPEGYNGRYPDGYLSIESMTPMIYNVSYDVTIRRYILNRQLPLWNSNKGIGTPFAAQGEGSPYFPLTIIRSLLPYNYWNYVTFLGFFLAAIFLFLFLREMAISKYAAYIGSYFFVLSGALGGQIIATNITSSLTVAPLLFWVSVRAIKAQTLFWRSLFSIAVALQMLAGHIQMAFVILISLIIFCLHYIWIKEVSFFTRIRESVVSMWYLILGIGLASFLLLPTLESLGVAYHNKEIRDLHSLPISWLLAFIYPLIFGLFRESWFHINWLDLFAYSGQGMIVAVIGGVASRWNNRFHRSMFWFFITIALFWILRYTGFPFLTWIWKLPFLSVLSPKHSNGFIVFCLSIAAAFAIEHLKNWKVSRLITILLISFASAVFVFLAIVAKNQNDAVHSVLPYIVISIMLSLITAAVFIYARRLSNISLTKAWQFLLIAMSAELIFYIPLGNSSFTFLSMRFWLYIVILFTALVFIKKRSFLIPYLSGFPAFYKLSKGKYLIIVMITVAVGMFILLIYVPNHGLPNQFDVTVPPKHIVWLKERLSAGERTFGIRPDYQTLADIQNIDTNGPFQPYGFANFINLIEGNVSPTERGWFNNGYFDINLTQYNMNKYILHKPFFDWIGVKYIVLEKGVFDKRREEYNVITNSQSGLKTSYEDSAVTILESLSPTSRAYFSSNYKIYPSGSLSAEAIIKFFKNNQSYIAQMTLLEDPTLNNFDNNVVIKTEMLSVQMPVKVNNYEPNYIRLEVDAFSPGVVVLKDAFYPGWRAYINNTEVPILRANGMVRAIKIDHQGKHVVEFRYMPSSFVYGLMLSGVIMIFFVSSVSLSSYRRARLNGRGVSKI